MSNTNLKNVTYQLYFDRDKKIYIDFTLGKSKNCQDLYNRLKIKIEEKITEIYGKAKEEKTFNFILINVNSKINNKIENSKTIELQLNNETPIRDLIISRQYYLCYLPKEKRDMNFKKIRRNNLEIKKESNFLGVELDSLITNNLENYLINEKINLFDKITLEYIPGKGNINEIALEIETKKKSFKLKISTIRKIEYYENKIPPILEGLKIKSKKQNYVFIIYHDNISEIFGLNQYKSFLLWKKAIELAKTRYNNINVNSIFDSNISTYNYQLFVRCHSIPNKCTTINQIMDNLEKRQIFLEEFTDKKISDIISSIYSYKINIKQNNFFEAWMSLKQISFYVDFDNIEDKKQKEREIEKYSNIFTKERIDLYDNTVKKVNDAISQIKNIQNYEEEMNTIFKNFFKIDLFDKLFVAIYELYIVPYYQKIKKILNTEYEFDQKPFIVQKYHLLLSKYCINYFNIRNIDNFNCLCSSFSTRNYSLANPSSKNLINKISFNLNDNSTESDQNTDNIIFNRNNSS
jgi:hypothetical protein